MMRRGGDIHHLSPLQSGDIDGGVKVDDSQGEAICDVAESELTRAIGAARE
jgi:hypothetical protein